MKKRNWVIGAMVLGEIFFLLGSFALASAYEVVTGPTILVRAVVKPYIAITVTSPVTISDNTPVIEFNVDRGPGVYRALYPLTLKVTSNEPIKICLEATALQSPEGYSIPAERLSVELRDSLSSESASRFRVKKGKGPEKRGQSFQEGTKVELVETVSPVDFLSEWDFYLEITQEDRAGSYEGKMFVEVFRQM